MRKLAHQQAGSHIVAVILAVFVIGAVGFAAWRVMSSKNKQTATTTQQAPTDVDTDLPKESAAPITWQFNGTTWGSSGSAPACGDPLRIKLPVQLSSIASILYPGQTRGGDYKPHGGFKVKAIKTNVVAPMDATAIGGSRYIEGGEVQYILDFQNSCGIAYRFDHLFTLSPAMQKLAATLPQAKVDDSRTTNFATPATIKAGDLIATEVGHKNTNNSGFDFGVYDLRQQNSVSKTADYANKHQDEKGQAFYAVCWLDLMAEKTQLRALPATDMAMGKTSDYC